MGILLWLEDGAGLTWVEFLPAQKEGASFLPVFPDVALREKREKGGLRAVSSQISKME